MIKKELRCLRNAQRFNRKSQNRFRFIVMDAKLQTLTDFLKS